MARDGIPCSHKLVAVTRNVPEVPIHNQNVYFNKELSGGVFFSAAVVHRPLDVIPIAQSFF